MPDQTQLPDQPDGIDEQTHDLPDPARSAERVGEYIKASGDGLYDVQDGNPLYARDLEALTRVPTKLADLQEELSRRTHTLDLVRRELGATREEADRFGAELADLRRERTQLVLDLGNMRGIAQGNKRHVATLSVLLERVEKLTVSTDGDDLDDGAEIPVGEIRRAMNEPIRGTALVPGSSRRAPEQRACRVCGCTDDAACEGGCWWVPDPSGAGDLCSTCALASRRAQEPEGFTARYDAACDAVKAAGYAFGVEQANMLLIGLRAADRPAAESLASEPAPADVDPVLAEVAAELARQDSKWGQQNHPLIDPAMWARWPVRVAEEYEIPTASRAQFLCQTAAARRQVTWAHILVEEVAEFVGGGSAQSMRDELIQVAAVAVNAVKCIDRAGREEPAAPKLAQGAGIERRPVDLVDRTAQPPHGTLLPDAVRLLERLQELPLEPAVADESGPLAAPVDGTPRETAAGRCGPDCSEGHTYEAGCAIKPPARAFLGERPCGRTGCPCGS